MDKFATPHISASNAVELRTLYNDRLKQSLLSLIGSAGRGLKKNLEELTTLTNMLPTDQRIHPAIFEANHNLAGALRSNSAIRVNSSLSHLRDALSHKVHWEGIRIDTVHAHSYQDCMLQTMSLDSVLGGQILAMPNDRLEEETRHCREALSVIATYASEMDGEIQTLVSGLNLFQGARKGRGVIGASDVRVFGDIFLRGNLYDMDPCAYYCEHLVHETSHYYLHALMAFDKMVQNNPAERYPAPIRHDPRPMFGIFHATFVLSRMVWVFERITAATGDPAFAKALDIFRRQFRKGYDVVKENAQLSPLGWQIVSKYASMIDVATI